MLVYAVVGNDETCIGEVSEVLRQRAWTRTAFGNLLSDVVSSMLDDPDDNSVVIKIELA